MKKITLISLLMAHNVFSQTLIPNPPEVSATSFLLIDAKTKTVITSSEPNQSTGLASITKIMTSYVVADQISKGFLTEDTMVDISEECWRMEGSRMFIKEGTEVSISELLKGVIIQSGNDASCALAEKIAGSQSAFADLMNNYAEQLGLENTNFVNPTGLPDINHYSTANDIAKLSIRLIEDFPDNYALFKEKEYTFNNIRQLNRNKLLWRDESVDGIKTGHTEAAGYCLIASAKRNDMRLVTVVAGSKSDKERFDASQRLLEYGFRFYAAQKLLEGNKELKSSTVWGGKKESVSIGLENDLLVTLPRGDFRNLTINYTIQNNIQAPIKAGDELGLVEVISNNNIVVSESLIALEDIDEKGFFGRMIAKIILWFIGLFNFND